MSPHTFKSHQSVRRQLSLHWAQRWCWYLACFISNHNTPLHKFVESPKCARMISAAQNLTSYQTSFVERHVWDNVLQIAYHVLLSGNSAPFEDVRVHPSSTHVQSKDYVAMLKFRRLPRKPCDAKFRACLVTSHTAVLYTHSNEIAIPHSKVELHVPAELRFRTYCTVLVLPKNRFPHCWHKEKKWTDRKWIWY